MKPLFCLLLAVSVSGCATTFYDRHTGRPIARFTGDMTNSIYIDDATYWQAEKVLHSTATRAAGSFAGTAGTAITGIATALATRGLVH